jgi:hypothetical protein
MMRLLEASWFFSRELEERSSRKTSASSIRRMASQRAQLSRASFKRDYRLEMEVPRSYVPTVYSGRLRCSDTRERGSR